MHSTRRTHEASTAFDPPHVCSGRFWGFFPSKLVRSFSVMNPGDPQVVGLVPVLIVVGVIVLLLFGVLALLSRFYRQVDQGRALVVNTMRSEPVVAFTGAIVYPIINRAEIMDLSVKTIDIDRRGKEGLICNDNIRADINVTFFVRVNKTVDDVLKVAQSVGCQRASDAAALSELFSAKFAEALKTVGKHFNFEELYTKRDAFKDKIIEVIGKDLNGFILDDAAIDYLEQTPLEALDKDNIMDADGIRKITDLTVIQNLKTNELRQKERMETGSQNLTADEAVFRFEQRRSEAEAKKNKEVAVAQARESNEALRVASEEHKKTVLITTKNEEEAQIAEQNKERGVAIAQKAREREIAVETERVEKARALEAIGREREVALVGIARDKEVEQQKKEIANVIRDRISVEKNVAAEEEQIKDLRNTSEATRKKESVRIAAEASAQEVLVKQVKAAEASEEAAKFKARERILLADSELDTADKTARAKIRIAEGVQAEAAAEGLAKVRVREADASAIEKQGLVEAKVAREKLLAEAAGLAQKAESMKLLDGAGRGHEEFRLRLDKEKSVELEKIRARKEVVAAQAQILAQAMGNARINIVGGDGQFLERFMSAISMGQAVDGALDQSETLRDLVQSLMNGNGGTGLAEALDKLAPLVTPAGKEIVVEEVHHPRPR